VTPILVRPVREQLEHDRVIRLLQQRWRRKYLVGMNQGSETTASVVHGESTLYPDLVLAPLDRPNKPEIVVEVETGESVNNLEAMAEWARLGQLKAAFHLYVPTGSVDSARRLCTDHSIPVAEIWTYHLVGDQMRFTMVYKAPAPSRSARQPVGAVRPSSRRAEPRRPSAANGPARKAAAAKRPAKPVAVKRAQPRKVAAKPAPRVQKRK
jgi:hypothetical protein